MVRSTNSWLLEKRRNLIGDDQFIPRDYGHLLWHWGYVDGATRNFLKRYGRLRGIALASQGRVVRWTNDNMYSRRVARGFSEVDRVKIEAQWRCLVAGKSSKALAQLDWLTQDPIDYNVTRTCVIKRWNDFKQLV